MANMGGASGGLPNGGDASGGPSLPPVTPFGAPTERPDEDIMSGIDKFQDQGAGAPDYSDLRKFLPMLETVVNRPDVPSSVRQIYQKIAGN